MSDRKRHGFVLLLVFGLLAASIVALFTAHTELGLDLRGGVQLVYQAEPTPGSPKVTQANLSKAVSIMESRVDSLGVTQPQIETAGGNQIEASLPDVHDVARAEQIVGSTSKLYFYDWEANAITPNGQTVASQLEAQNSQAELISQGSGSGGPGAPDAGSMPLYQAVTLAAKQTAAPASKSLSRLGPEVFLFGAPGSAACQAVAADHHTKAVAGEHCYIAGGQDISTRAELAASGLPKGTSIAGNELVSIPQGWVVLQATNTTTSSAAPGSNLYASGTQYYVLHDNVALTGAEITNPEASTGQGGVGPDVQFGFTSKGATAFQDTTSAIAHRASDLGLHNGEYQHFATALNGQLLTVPYINQNTDPDGIVSAGGSAGAEISGNFTTQTAQDLATQLRLGSLPINLHRISENQVSATLGSQALHDGVLAGGIGLLVVIAFLILYYRVLGLIATSTLLIYAVYFYALIKLIPIVLTLAGIAGLILTIGVAADANIVIFERVKEEIRAGRSVRSGIVIGYKKGLSAIIDANVVTIITAFILFVLSTQEVQGFAFTLGIGTIVSLFTAVLATQAILQTAGDSPTLARPSALGAGKPKRQIRFDFMGKSKYFFTMSGGILLIGALAIGGRGLKLGIDFTSGSKVTETLNKAYSISTVQNIANAVKGVSNATVERIGGSSSHVYEVSFKAGPTIASNVRDALTSKLGGTSPSIDSIGPTFGASVTHAAIIAIIASLIVISAYVALRFERKFAVPVLIALAHDLLITAGIYALTGKQVTVDTVAALLTILGYSLYDTIIVFDRIRENVPRMPRATFTQIVNRSMSEVITRSLATTTCTLLPIIALVLFGGSQLEPFAFALLIGVASGAYSSIFIASPVLTHWKEREPLYRNRRRRVEERNNGMIPAYAAAGSDVAPRERAAARRARLTEPGNEGQVSAAEFEEMKRDIAEEEEEPGRRTSTLTRRMASTDEDELSPEQQGGSRAERRAAARRSRRSTRPAPGAAEPQAGPGPEPEAAPEGGAAPVDGGSDEGFEHAPDEVENEGMLPGDDTPRRRPNPNPRRNRGRGHGRR